MRAAKEPALTSCLRRGFGRHSILSLFDAAPMGLGWSLRAVPHKEVVPPGLQLSPEACRVGAACQEAQTARQWMNFTTAATVGSSSLVTLVISEMWFSPVI